ncbi:MAG: tetratricopeptide repeat protein [Gallionella sp.]|nr:tetratricopeptide repeat protein [Gallionella sp.]MDP1941061.1 tetratricopeptide repeat protein [Gallionella sp.]
MNASNHLYNPDWLSDEALVTNFVARREDYVFLRNELARVPVQGTVQHYLLVGMRGAGKTTMLKRLAVAIRRDDDLKDHLIALSFPEELYQVKCLADFWWAACDALVDELDHLGLREQADHLASVIDQYRNGADTALNLLLKTCEQMACRPVLLVDNLDLVFQRIDKSGRKLKDPHAAAYWELREALSTANAPIVIGGTVRLSEPFTDYDKAFYDFFIPKRLGKLALDEVLHVLERLADAQGVPEVKQRLHDRPSRIEALFELTGGNPRALGLIFELLRSGPGGRAVEDFERLMDITTPYYKARFEDMSEQAQVVMHALAVRRPGDGSSLRFGHTAAEIGLHAGLPTGTVSAQMDIMVREGLVEKSAAHGRTQYRIAEQLFRLWLQMRSTRRIRQNVIGLTEFLEAMFDFDELQSRIGDEPASPLADAKLAFAVAGAGFSVPMRKGLEAYGADRLLQHLAERGGEMDDYLPFCDLPEELSQIVSLREQLQQCGSLNQVEQQALLGSLDMKPEQKQASAQALCDKATSLHEVARLRPLFDAERQRLLRYGLREADLPLLFGKRSQGLLPLPRLMPEDVESACVSVKDPCSIRSMIWRLVGAREWVKFASSDDAQSWLDWGANYASEADSTEWANVAGAMRRSEQYVQAQLALDREFKQGESSRAWYEFAALLDMVDGDLVQVETAYRKATEFDPADGWAWNALGHLLADKLQRYDEAEIAYREAIKVDPKEMSAWYRLGHLFIDKLNRYDEAESVYLKALEIDPTDTNLWILLGGLRITKSSRYQDAEADFRKVTELKPMDEQAWALYGASISIQMQRQDEAEAALRKSIELNPRYAEGWMLLGDLLLLQLHRYEEAEAAYREAIKITPDMVVVWHSLAMLLELTNRLDEALVAYEHGAELDKVPHPRWKERRAALQIRICAEAVQKALQSGSQADLRNALSRLLTDSADIAASLVSAQFVEGFLAPLLKNLQHARVVLTAMRESGYEKYARPMLLAFEAAMTHRPEMLSELEPEIQVAAKHMYDRLAGKKPKKKRAAVKKEKKAGD